MAETNQSQTQQSSPPATAAKPKPRREPKKGDAVHVVTARGHRVKATIAKTHANGSADLELHDGSELNGAQRDDAGTCADSWHFPADEESNGSTVTAA